MPREAGKVEHWDVRQGIDDLQGFFEAEKVVLNSVYSGRRLIRGQWRKGRDGWEQSTQRHRDYRGFLPSNYTCTPTELWRLLENIHGCEWTVWMADCNKEYGNIYPEFDTPDREETIDDEFGGGTKTIKQSYNQERQDEHVQRVADMAALCSVPMADINALTAAFAAEIGRTPRFRR